MAAGVLLDDAAKKPAKKKQRKSAGGASKRQPNRNVAEEEEPASDAITPSAATGVTVATSPPAEDQLSDQESVQEHNTLPTSSPQREEQHWQDVGGNETSELTKTRRRAVIVDSDDE